MELFRTEEIMSEFWNMFIVAGGITAFVIGIGVAGWAIFKTMKHEES